MKEVPRLGACAYLTYAHHAVRQLAQSPADSRADGASHAAALGSQVRYAHCDLRCTAYHRLLKSILVCPRQMSGQALRSGAVGRRQKAAERIASHGA